MQASKVGGAALLKTSSDWSSTTLSQLSDKHGKVYAGSMFVTDQCTSLMPQDDETPPLPYEENSTRMTPVAEKAISDDSETKGAAMGQHAKTWLTMVLACFVILCVWC